jgi:hypothetical protein
MVYQTAVEFRASNKLAKLFGGRRKKRQAKFYYSSKSTLVT